MSSCVSIYTCILLGIGLLILVAVEQRAAESFDGTQAASGLAGVRTKIGDGTQCDIKCVASSTVAEVYTPRVSEL